MRRRIVLLAILILANLAPREPAAARSVPFPPAHLIDESFDGAVAVAYGDLDGDGDIDVVSASSLADDVTWWESDGSPADGGWTAHTIDGAFTGASSLALGDVDGDGDIDVVATAESLDDVTWFDNDGTPTDGGWTARVVSGVFDGAWAVTLADIDGDGDLDVLGAAHFADDITWWENDGTSNVSNWTARFIASSFGGASSLTAADLDGDGDLDLVATAELADDVTWWQNDGTANVANWTMHTIDGAFAGASSVAVGDLDRDGDLDVAATAAAAGHVAWWQSDGTPADGGWTEHTIAPTFAHAADVDVSDLDSDGDLDVAAAAYSAGHVAWWENDGTPGDEGWIAHAVDPVAGGPRSVTAGDLDRDGDLDLLAAAYDADDVLWYENRTIHRSAVFAPPARFSQPGQGPPYPYVSSATAPGDIDGDGDLDLVAAGGFLGSGGGVLTWRENDSSLNAWTWTAHTIDDAFTGASDVAVDDVDGDGDLDVVATAANLDAVTWFDNDGTPADGGWTMRVISGAFDGATGVTLADIDGDGDVDVLATAPVADDITWWENDGTSTVSNWTAHALSGSFDGASLPRIADLDGDGDLDVIASAGGAHELAWWQNDGTTNSGSWVVRTIAGMFAAESVAVEDLDRDGALDVVATSYDAYNGAGVAWWQNDGTPADGGWIAHAIIDPLFSGGLDMKVADLDADGDLDVAAAEFDGLALWWANDGTASDEGWTRRPIDSHPLSYARNLAVADLDHDGRTDLLGGTFGGELWWRNIGGQLALPTTIVPPGGLARIVDGAAAAVLRVSAEHRGRPGDHDAELATFKLRFERSAGFPLSTPEASALVTRLHVYLDEGSGTFGASDTLVGSVDTLALDGAGVQTLAFTDDDPAVRIPFAAPRTYFVVVEMTPNASVQSPNRCRLTHLTHLTQSTSTGEDAPFDVPLLLDATPDVAVDVQAVSDVLFRDGFE